MSTHLQPVRDLLETSDGEDLPSLVDTLLCTLDIEIPDGELLPIAEVSELTGITAHTLRYYERIGLVRVGRDSGGRRAYDADAIGRVIFLSRLRASEMSIREIQRYVDLVEAGDQTIPDRLHLLESHRTDLLQRLDDLRWALAVIDYKIVTYGGTCGDAQDPPNPKGTNP